MARKQGWIEITKAQLVASLDSCFSLGTREVSVKPTLYEEGWVVFVYKRPKKGKQKLIGASEGPFDSLTDAINSAFAEVGGFRQEDAK